MAKPSLETERRSQDEYRRRAALGDPDAQFYLAWDYFKGRLVAKDIPTAISFLRQLEKTSPQLARFNIAKMKYLVGDDSLKDDIRIDCEAGFGPALYLMAGNSYRKGSQTDLAEALSYFEAAARNGHLLSRIWAWRLSRRGFWHRVATSISLLPMIVQIIVVMMRNEKDVRVWH
jgi:TPR repeat protein